MISFPGGTADCCCCCRDVLELDMRGELAADDDLDILGLSPFTLLLAEPILDPESVLGAAPAAPPRLGLGSGTFDALGLFLGRLFLGLFLGLLDSGTLALFLGLGMVVAAVALRGAPAVAELTLRPVDPTPPRGVALADAVPGRFLVVVADDALCSSFMSVSSDSDDLIDGRLDSLLW